MTVAPAIYFKANAKQISDYIWLLYNSRWLGDTNCVLSISRIVYIVNKTYILLLSEDTFHQQTILNPSYWSKYIVGIKYKYYFH